MSQNHGAVYRREASLIAGSVIGGSCGGRVPTPLSIKGPPIR